MKSLSVVVLFAAACGASGDDSSSIEELRAALPVQSWVAMAPVISQPSALTSCRTLGASTFGVLTYKIAADADGVVGSVLGVVQTITKSPPTATGLGHAVCGPIASPTSSGYRRQVDKSARGEFTSSSLAVTPPLTGAASSRASPSSLAPPTALASSPSTSR